MESPELISLIIRLVVGAIATFFAILLWSSTRDSAWMFAVIGTIIQYGQIMYSTFRVFGILQEETLIYGFPVFSILLANLPSVCFIIAFLIAMSRTKLR
jgi:hypothetical protein